MWLVAVCEEMMWKLGLGKEGMEPLFILSSFSSQQKLSHASDTLDNS